MITALFKPTCFIYNINTGRLSCQINFGEFSKFLEKFYNLLNILVFGLESWV